MPGIYSKPSRRAEFASDIRCLVEAATDRLDSGGEWDAYVQTLVEEIEAERAKARQEVPKGGAVVGGASESDNSAAERAKFQQLVARKEIEVAEVFFECGIHELFCKLLEKVNKSMNPALFEQILGLLRHKHRLHVETGLPCKLNAIQVYQVLQLVEFDPFDDDMGLVSVLNFFLSERHSYYVDIHWRDNELNHMHLFLGAMLRFISCRIAEESPSELSQSAACDLNVERASKHSHADPWKPLQVTATRLLHATLWTFPPHRVVSRMAFSFTRVRCLDLLKSFAEMLASSSDVQVLQLQAEVIAAVAFFGVGPSLVKKAVPASLSWSCSSFACRDERCPCSTCEFQRRLLKLLRNRDELGVQASTEAKRQICYSLVRAGVSDFLQRALLATTAAARKQAVGENPHPSVPEIGKTFQAIAWILLLCSWAYEDVYQGQSILSANNTKLLVLVGTKTLLVRWMKSLCESPQVSAIEALESVYSASSTTELYGSEGASSLLRVVAYLLLKTRMTQRRCLMLVAKPTFMNIASCLCTRLHQLSPSTTTVPEVQPKAPASLNSSAASGTLPTVPVSDSSLDPKERALTTSLVLLSLVELIFDPEVALGSTISETGDPQEQAFKVPPSIITLALQACHSLVEIYEYLHPRFASLREEAKAESTAPPHDFHVARVPEELRGQAGFEHREFFLGLIGIMAVLMGGLALQGVEQIRWRFIENPAAAIEPASAGGFASSARLMLSHYRKAQDEGCQIVKKLANLVILRSEQAAGMVLRGKTKSV